MTEQEWPEINSFTMAAVLSYLSAGAVLIANDAFQGDLCVVVWPDGRTLPLHRYMGISLADSDFLDVVRSTADGLEFTISADGRDFLNEWGPRLTEYTRGV